jgi:hypothetical protein
VQTFRTRKQSHEPATGAYERPRIVHVGSGGHDGSQTKVCFSPECEAGLKEQFKSGLEVYKIGLYEFRERIKEAETNIEKLVQLIIGEEIARDPASQLLHESSMFAALYARKLCPGLWPLC